jgi:hypothetical protein
MNFTFASFDAKLGVFCLRLALDVSRFRFSCLGVLVSQVEFALVHVFNDTICVNFTFKCL